MKYIFVILGLAANFLWQIIWAITPSTVANSYNCNCHDNGTNWNLTNKLYCSQQNFTCVCNSGYQGKNCDTCQPHFYNIDNTCKTCPCLLSQSDGSCYTNVPDKNVKCSNCKNGFTGDLCNECPTQHYLSKDQSGNLSCIACNCSNVQKIYEEEKNCDKKLMMECFTCLTFERRNKCSPFGYETSTQNTTFPANDSIPVTPTSPVPSNESTKLNDLNLNDDPATNPSSFYTITLSVIVIISLTVTAFILVTVILFILKSRKKNKFIWYHYLHPQAADDNSSFAKKKAHSSQSAILNNDELQLSHEENCYPGKDGASAFSILNPYPNVDGLEHLKDDNPYRFSHDQNMHHTTNKPILGFLLR